MSDASEKACSITLKAWIGGEERYVSQFTASIGIGASAWPSVQLVSHKKVDAYDRAEQLGTAQVAAEMGARQKEMFSPKQREDVVVRISIDGDDEAGSFFFNGLVSGPTYAFGPYAVERSDYCVPDYAFVESLSYAAYSANLVHLEQLEKPNLLDSGTIVAFINDLQKHLMSTFDPAKLQDASDKSFTKAQHKINQLVVKYFEELLEESDGEEKFGWTKVTEKLKQYDVNLRSVVLSTLAQQAGPFSTTIDRLAEIFMCVYVPDWTRIGRFINKYNLFKAPKNLELIICGISIDNSSGFGLLPTGFVGVTSPYLLPSSMGQTPVRHFVVYPKENAESGIGMMYQSLGPAWISDTIAKETSAGTPGTGGESIKDAKRDKGLDPADAQKQAQTQQKSEEQVSNDNLTILEEWAKSQYIHIALAKSVVQVRIPVNFKPEIGTFYNVSAKEGGALFKGVLTHIEHFISAEGNNPQAYTTLTFSYVQMTGFTLPGS